MHNGVITKTTGYPVLVDGRYVMIASPIPRWDVPRLHDSPPPPQPAANVLSEERGWVDARSALTLVVDPVDGSANAAAGIPLSCFSAAAAIDDEFTEAMTCWLHARNREAWWRVASTATRVRILSCSTLESVFVATGASDAFLDAGSDTHHLMDIAGAMVSSNRPAALSSTRSTGPSNSTPTSPDGGAASSPLPPTSPMNYVTPYVGSRSGRSPSVPTERSGWESRQDCAGTRRCCEHPRSSS